MFNKSIIIGNLTRDLDTKYSAAGSAIVNTAIAATRKYKVNGEAREDVLFVDIVFFGRLGEIAAQYLRKGSKCMIEGRLQLDQWTDQNGQKRSKHSIVVENMEMLDAPSGQQAAPAQQQHAQPAQAAPAQQAQPQYAQPAQAAPAQQAQPQYAQPAQAAPAQQAQAAQAPISEDEIPF